MGGIYIWKGRIIFEREGYEEETSEDQQYSKIELPRSIFDFHLIVFLVVDYMIIQRIPLMHSISNNTKFRTVESIIGKESYKKDILGAINRVLNLYQSRGFQVKEINGDNEFMCITNNILPIKMNIVAADEQVGEVERSI